MPRNLKKIHALAKRTKLVFLRLVMCPKEKVCFFDDGNSSFKIEDNGWQHFR
ncbi:MAG: hypothetical protein Ct9H300mP17_13360 [Candidatus Nitrosopelagicus sp.]|nr:MAG: hypothetical protein Ct9H300mP17_13360 [Candidatus Nitrosopelagicus sp.]